MRASVWVIIGVIVIVVVVLWPDRRPFGVRPETRARAMMNGLTTAISGYNTEYGHFPNPKGLHANQKISTLHNSGLIECLMGLKPSDSTDDPNPRRIQFISPPDAKHGKAGYDAATGDLLDPWGQPLWILMDVEQKGYLENPYYGAPDYPSETQKELGMGCIIWDFGADRIDGTKARSTDDLRSWH